ncbi:hypothetical protein DH2020_025602 [Rehmannia glutinosa]|uniref:Ubiquitin carboxyl-terminal hydrolase n=1 Tax=Rehmannia glutinosa TaxID=99300 RepID=A0ABR0VZA8_REHGL
MDSPSPYDLSPCSDESSPESNDEALFLEDESGTEGTEDDDKLINSENTESNSLESQSLKPVRNWPGQTSMGVVPRPPFSTWLSRHNKPAVIGAGLLNLGNTCFLNSVLQCFIHTVPLLHGILSDKHSVHSNCNRDGFCVLCSLRWLIKLSLTSQHRFVEPDDLVNNLSYFSSSFQKHQQEDAHEFLQCFLDKLESCHDSSQSHNIVKQVFGGRLVSQLKCCNCGHCSDTYEPSIDLSLEIEDADNLLTALQSFTKVEEIEDPETKFTCENCKEQVSVEKQLLLDQAPSVAVFHLKRFKSDGYFVQKLDKHVAFPLDLDLLPFTGNSKKNDMELKYVLYAIVVHVGLTSTSGHYYCFIRLSPSMWCKFDDDIVELVHEDFVLSQQAYILFYAKEGTYWFSSFIESQIFSVHPTIWNTSPKSVLDRVETSPVSSSLQNKIDNDCTEASHDVGSEHRQVANNEIKDSGRKQDKFEINESRDNLHRMSALVAPPCPSVYSPEVPSHEAHKEVSPTLREKVNRSLEKACVAANSQIDTPQEEPLRSPSPEIYREDPPGFSIPRNHLRTVDRIACKRRLDKDMDDLETRQAFSFVKKNMPGSRGQQMLDALRRSKTEASVNRKKGRKSGQDDSSIRPVLRPLVAGTHR